MCCACQSIIFYFFFEFPSKIFSATKINFIKLCIYIEEGEISFGTPNAPSNRAMNTNNYELSEFDARGPTYRYDH